MLWRDFWTEAHTERRTQIQIELALLHIYRSLNREPSKAMYFKGELNKPLNKVYSRAAVKKFKNKLQEDQTATQVT